jgi:hypothetical protein
MYLLLCLVFLLGVYFLFTLFHPLHLVWDLDQTLIRSVQRSQTGKPQKEEIFCSCWNKMYHIDDDGITFETFMRPHARWLLSLFFLLRIKQYVFTSASQGYMNNVVTFLDPWGWIFESKKMWYEKGMDLTKGKDISLLSPFITLKNALLIDDNPKYHQAHRPGYLIAPFDKDDHALLHVGWKILQCLFVIDVRLVL